jgi:hypothetical protein
MNRATAVMLLTSLAAALMATGCAGRGSTPATNATPQSTPAATAPSPTASTPSAPPVAAFRSSAATLSSSMRARMTGVSWHPGCPVSLDQLRLLRVSYWGLDGAARQGELVVNKSAAPALSRAFGQLFAARFPIRQMRVVDDFGGDDERSMLADNTSAFNCRQVPGSTAWSQHAYGLAVDVNPFENPEVRGDAVDPPAAAAWADRTRTSPAMISHGDSAWRAFDEIGWPWGGDWRSLKDYQHFSANGL